MNEGEVQLHECEDMSVQASFTQVTSANKPQAGEKKKQERKQKKEVGSKKFVQFGKLTDPNMDCWFLVQRL